MGAVFAIPPALEDPPLRDCDFRDAFALDLAETIDAPRLAWRILSAPPAWVVALMRLRNAAVRPLGLRGDRLRGPAIGWFPLLSETPDRVVLGLDDRHLDFRLTLETAPLPGGQGTRAIASTFVRTHNRLGRAYLSAIMPFHKAIVPAVLARAAEKPSER